MKRLTFPLMLSLAVCSPIMADYHPGASMGSPYADIDPSHWAYKQIRSLYDAGILKADGTGLFKGNERVSRYEAVGLVYAALQHVNQMQANGMGVDPGILDTINSLITELTDEMQVAEVRIEENADAISHLRNYVHSMYGKPTQGASFQLGQSGRVKISGQASFSLTAGGANSAYGTLKGNNAVAPAGPNPSESTVQFGVDSFQLAIAADIDHKTSFFTRGLGYMGGNADTAAAGGFLSFNDYMYFHVKELWSDWDMTLGRMYVPWGHETGGAFDTNPYFISNSMVDFFYGGMMEGAYFSRMDQSRSWDWGVGLHNGSLHTPANAMGGGAMNMASGSGYYNHLYPYKAMPMNTAGGAANGLENPGMPYNLRAGAAAGAGVNGLNTNDDKSFGFALHVGNRSRNHDFQWDLNYFTNGGGGDTTAPGAGMGALSFINLGATYRPHSRWRMSAEIVTGSVESGNGARVSDSDDFATWYIQPTYHLSNRSDLSLRYGKHEYDRWDAAGAAGANNDDDVSELTVAWARRVSDNGTLLLENTMTDWDKANGNKPAGFAADKYDVFRASYRLDF